MMSFLNRISMLKRENLIIVCVHVSWSVFYCLTICNHGLYVTYDFRIPWACLLVVVFLCYATFSLVFCVFCLFVLSIKICQKVN